MSSMHMKSGPQKQLANNVKNNNARLMSGQGRSDGQLLQGKAPAKSQSVFKSVNAQKQKVTNKQIYQDYIVICKIIEAKLSKDLSTFFSQMSVQCEVKFTSTHTQLGGETAESITSEYRKSTGADTGQNPSWQEMFSFNYQRLTKYGQKQIKLALQQNANLKGDIQQLDFTLFKKTLLFTNEKIGETTVQLHNATSGSRTDWLILTNDKEEIVGKLLAYIEINEDNTSKQIQDIQNDLKMQDQSINDSVLPGMTKDMTEDKGMPLRNHEQVMLLNDRSEPQTHITHQTQNSAMQIGGLGAHLGKSPNMLSSSISGAQHRATSNSMMGATNLTHVSNPAVGAPLYLDTTNILPSNKVNKTYGAMTAVVHNQTDNCDDEEDYGEEDEDDAQAKKQRQEEGGSMLMGMMGVVATQHIREEYDEDEEYGEEEEEEEQEEAYAGLRLAIGETPPVVEGGGPSSGVNTHGRHTGARQSNTMAVGEVVLGQGGGSRFHQGQLANVQPSIDPDDESNINSDEQDEYLEHTNYNINKNKGTEQMRPNTAQNINNKQLLKQSKSAQNINGKHGANGQMMSHYSSQQQFGKGQYERYNPLQQQQQQAQYQLNVPRSVKHMHHQQQMPRTTHGSIPRGPHPKNKRTMFNNIVNDNQINSKKINIKTLEVEPSFRQRDYRQQQHTGNQSSMNRGSYNRYLEQNLSKNYGQLYSHTEEAVDRNRGKFGPPREAHQFNIGQVDDADLLQNQSESMDSDQHQQEYQDMSEGDQENYPHKQPMMEPLAHSPIPVQRQSGKKKRRHEPASEASGSGQIGTNPLEQETFSMQQQDTFHHQPMNGSADPPYMLQYPSGSNYIHVQGMHQYNSEMQKQQQIRQFKSGGANNRPQTQQNFTKTPLGHEYDRKHANKLRIKGAQMQGSMVAHPEIHQDHSVIQHITSHSSHVSEGVAGEPPQANSYLPPRSANPASLNISPHFTQFAPQQSYPISRQPSSGMNMRAKQQQQAAGVGQQDLMHQYNSYQEYEDYMNNGYQQQPQQPQLQSTENNSSDQPQTQNIHHKNNSSKKRAQADYTSSISLGLSMGQPEMGNIDPFSQMAHMNNRAMSHEYQLNQMHKNVIYQFEKIKKEKSLIKQEKHKIKEENSKLQQKQKDIESKQFQIEKQYLQLKREKIMVANEMSKTKRVYDQLEQMLGKTKSREIKEELSSVRMLLELLMNDRDMLKQESSVDFDLEKNTAQFNDSEHPRSSSDRNAESKGTGAGASAAGNEREMEMIKQYQLKLEGLCNMYQKKLEEVSQSKESSSKQSVVQAMNPQIQSANPNDDMMANWQNMQIMNNQMRNQMTQLTQIQSQMATQMQQVQGMVSDPSLLQSQQIASQFAPSPMMMGSNFPQTPNEMQMMQSQQQQIFTQQASIPIISNTMSQNASNQHSLEHSVYPTIQQSEVMHAPEQLQQVDVQNQSHQEMPSQFNAYPEQQQPVIQPTPLVSPSVTLEAQHQPVVENVQQQQEQQPPVVQADLKSSSSSEFVFNPDPNFLANINANIRSNNQNNDAQAIQQQREDELQRQQQEQMQAWQEEESYDDEQETSQEDVDQQIQQHYQEQDNEVNQVQQQQHNHELQNQIEQHHQQQQEQIQQVSENQNQEENKEGHLLEEQRRELISDCGSDIQISEEENKNQGSTQDNAVNDLSLVIDSDNNVNNNMRGNEESRNSKSMLQGAGAQLGDYQQDEGQNNQMSVFQSIQQKLQKIGQQNPEIVFNPPPANQDQDHGQSESEIDSPAPQVRKDVNGLEQMSALSSRDPKHSVQASAEIQSKQKKIDDEEILRLIHKNYGEAGVDEDQQSDQYDDYYHNFEEQSIIYKDQKVFDQPKRAKYGIKIAQNKF